VIWSDRSESAPKVMANQIAEEPIGILRKAADDNDAGGVFSVVRNCLRQENVSSEVAKELNLPDKVWDRAIAHAGDILDQTEK